jgi:hypothetical protein
MSEKTSSPWGTHETGMAKVEREIDRITALEVTMSPQRSEFGHPRRWPTVRYYRPLSENSMITGRAKPRFERSKLIDRITSPCTITSGAKLMIVATAELGGVKPLAMKVANAQKA